jgi:importin subunit beta-1
MRANIKDALLSLLAYEDLTVIKAAATCVAAVAVIDIPNGDWDGLIPLLSKNSNSDQLNIRLASIQTLGFICEDIDPSYLNSDNLNEILSALLTNVFPH